MNITSKLAVLAVCCAGAIGMTQPAKADSFSIGYHGGGWGGWHHSGYSVSLGVGGPYYGGGYYYGGSPAPRCFYDYYGYYHCRPYGYGGYYGPAYGISYYSGWGHPWYGGGWRGGWYGNGWRGGHDGHWNGNGNWHGGHGQNGGGNQGGNHWHH